MKKTFISKIGIMLTLIFSFLLSLLPSEAIHVNAASEVIQEIVELSSIERKENKITFKTRLALSIESITYQIVYYATESEKHADLVSDAKVEKINDYTYSFDVSDEIVGVKIWKVKYLFSTGYYKNKQTTGSNSIGDIEAVYKKNYVEVTTDKLEHIGGEACDLSGMQNVTCKKWYVFYFNLDTEIDWIVDLSLEYSIKTEKKTWWGISNSTSTQSYTTKLDHTQQVTDMYAVGDYIADWVEANKDATHSELVDTYEFAINAYKRPVLGANENGNGYDWYVQPLLDETLTDKQYVLGSGYQKQDLQEVAIVKMSYYSHGEYFDDIPVLDDDTGWIKYSEDESLLDKLIAWFDKNVNIVSVTIFIIAVIVVLKIINIPLSFFGLGMDKTSRLERKTNKLATAQLNQASMQLKAIKDQQKAMKLEQKREKKFKKNSYNDKSINNYYNHKNH